MADDRVTAALEQIRADLDWLRACAAAVAVTPEAFDLGELMPRYGRAVAAVEAVLAKAAEWSVEAAGLEGGHRGLADHGADKLRTAMYARSVALKDCEAQIREAITRELTGATDA